MEKMQNLIEKVIDISRSKKHSEKFSTNNFESFVKNFYLQNQGMDFLNYSEEELYNAALLSFEFFSKRELGKFKIRIYKI